MEENLIEAIKLHPCLFNKGDLRYRNKLMKEKAWMDVAVSTGLEEEVCKTRWRSLRDRYLKELKKKPPSGSGADVPVADWKHFESMAFLNDYVAPRRTWNNSFLNSQEASADESGLHLELGLNSTNSLFEGFADSSPPAAAAQRNRTESNSTTNSLFEGFADNSSPPAAAAQRKRVRTEEASARFEVLMGAVQEIVSKKTTEEKSRNTDYLKTLDSYLLQLPPIVQDRLKLKFLEMVGKEVNAAENIFF